MDREPVKTINKYIMIWKNVKSIFSAAMRTLLQKKVEGFISVLSISIMVIPLQSRFLLHVLGESTLNFATYSILSHTWYFWKMIFITYLTQIWVVSRDRWLNTKNLVTRRYQTDTESDTFKVAISSTCLEFEL